MLNITSHGNGKSGIQFTWSEFIAVEGNTTYDNASDGWFWEYRELCVSATGPFPRDGPQPPRVKAEICWRSWAGASVPWG